MEGKFKPTYKSGLIILIILAVLTAIEFALAATLPWAWILFLIALLKAWFVIQHYMHLPRLFKSERGE
jgi:hypothetical protein